VKEDRPDAALLLAARNLALAASAGTDLVTLCSACLGTLARAAQQLESDPGLMTAVNKRLQSEGLVFEPGPRVVHLARLLYERLGAVGITARVTRPLTGATVAVHYGCHYLRPSRLYGHGEPVEAPVSLTRLVEATGAVAVGYSEPGLCCGGGLLGVDEEAAYALAARKLGAMRAAAAGAVVLICPFCAIMYGANQKKIERATGESFGLPVLYYPQLLGLALGMTPAELGLDHNPVRAEAWLARIGWREGNRHAV
jgi:heterodisulfide reductase subunit B